MFSYCLQSTFSGIFLKLGRTNPIKFFRLFFDWQQADENSVLVYKEPLVSRRSVFDPALVKPNAKFVPVAFEIPEFTQITLPQSPDFETRNPSGFTSGKMPSDGWNNDSFTKGNNNYTDNTIIFFQAASSWDTDKFIENSSGQLNFEFNDSTLRLIQKESGRRKYSRFATINGTTSFKGKNLEIFMDAGWQDLISVSKGGEFKVDVSNNAWLEFVASYSTGSTNQLALLRINSGVSNINVGNQLVLTTKVEINQKDVANGLVTVLSDGELNLDAKELFIIADVKNPEDSFLNGIYVGSGSVACVGSTKPIDSLVMTGVASAFAVTGYSSIKVNANSLYADTIGKDHSLGYFLSGENGQAEINVTNNAEIKGNIYLKNGQYNLTFGQNSILETEFIDNLSGEINLSLGNGSFIKGKISDKSFISENSRTTLELDQSTWDVSGRSSFYKLNTHNSNIFLSDLGSSDNPTLQVGSLSGSDTTFYLYNEGNVSSFIQLGKDSTQGTHKVQLTGIVDTEEEVNIHFANDKSGNVTFVGEDSITDAGLFVITPELTASKASTGNNWYITNIKETPGPTPVAIIDGFQNNYLFWRTLTDSTKERFGQLRHGQETGVWGRITAGSLDKGDLSNDYQTYRLGADTTVSPGLSIGVMAEIHEGDLDTSNGSGEMQAYTASLYGLFVSPSGYYADAGLRLGVMDYDYKNTAMLYDKYDYQSTVGSIWLEVGKEWTFADRYTLTPHIAAHYGHFGTEDFRTQNNLKATVESVDSLIFTLGTDFGYKGDKFELSAVTDVMSEVSGDQKVRISHNDKLIDHHFDYSDTWMEFGLNAAYKPSENTLIWLNGRRSAFADIDNDWRINAGVRWLFQ